jgi:hypothetical protein
MNTCFVCGKENVTTELCINCLNGGKEMNKNKITPEHIKNIMDKSHFVVNSIFCKTTIVVCQLPNGFIIVESSSCVDPENYDVEIGTEICKKRIENKLWELEGYCLQNELDRL